MQGDYTSNNVIAINKLETLAGAPSRQILASPSSIIRAICVSHTYDIFPWGNVLQISMSDGGGGLTKDNYVSTKLHSKSWPLPYMRALSLLWNGRQ